VVVAVHRRAAAPAAAAGDIAVGRLDDEVRPVLDQLRVDAHHGAARLDLRLVEVGALQLGDGRVHDSRQARHVVERREARRELHRSMISLGRELRE
jgi:hypothetical protein